MKNPTTNGARGSRTRTAFEQVRRIHILHDQCKRIDQMDTRYIERVNLVSSFVSSFVLLTRFESSVLLLSHEPSTSAP